MLAPGKGKTQRAYLWAYAAARSETIKAVVYDFTPSRSGEHARAFLGQDPLRRERDQQPWSGHLVCDDFSGYKALFALGITEVGCMAQNNLDEQQIRPWAMGRKNWLFAGTLGAGQRAAAITSLFQSAKLNGHDPYEYLEDLLQRLPTQRASDIGRPLPHRWEPAGKTTSTGSPFGGNMGE